MKTLLIRSGEDMLRSGHLFVFLSLIVIYGISFLLIPKRKQRVLTAVCFCLSACVIAIMLCYHVDTSVPWKNYRETFSIRFITMDDVAGQILFADFSPDGLIREEARIFGYMWGTFLIIILLLGGSIPIRRRNLGHIIFYSSLGSIILLVLNVLFAYMSSNHLIHISGPPMGFGPHAPLVGALGGAIISRLFWHKAYNPHLRHHGQKY